MMKVNISDDFDLEKIIYSGQCFRPYMDMDGTGHFLTGNKMLSIKHICDDVYEVDCNQNDWDEIWMSYFDLNRKYSEIRKQIPSSDVFMKDSADAGTGIRILKQDKWEMLISFIISQRKSIPAIRSSVEKICKKWGKQLNDEVFAFPTAEELDKATTGELAECGLGYRVQYILDAVHCVKNGIIDLETIAELDDEQLFETLKTVKGVGDKVANCVLLFAYHRTGRAPVDTWIAKVINEVYDGKNPFNDYGENAGIMQQFVFYNVQNRKIL